jgi:hypothetical protein
VRPAGPILEQWDDTAHWGGRTAPAADIEARHLEALEAHTPGSQVGQVASRHSTSNAIWVDSPDGAPAELKRWNSVGPQT